MAQLVEAKYLRDFADYPVSNGPDWLQSLREKARTRFAQLEFPTRRDEEWRYTPVAPIVETPFVFSDPPPYVSPEQIAPYSLAATGACELVFVDGWFAPHLSTLRSLDNDVEIGSLADAVADKNERVRTHLARYADYDRQTFVALNTSILADGAYIYVPPGRVIDFPIHLLFFSNASDAPTVSHPRVLIVAGENSQATIVEAYVGVTGARYFTNAVTEIVCGENAVIDHYRMQGESQAAFHVSTTQVELARSSNFSSHSFGYGGSLVRNDINAVLAGEGIECVLNGLYRVSGRQLVDNHTFIDHAMPNCNSHELYKGIIDGNGRAVFNGKILVRQDAQKTNAKQTNQALLLSAEAQVNTKPQLEIYADDVKCTHGATIGQLSDEALFYLRSRGIDEDAARELLIYAYASDIVNRIKIDAIRDRLDQYLLSERAIEGIE